MYDKYNTVDTHPFIPPEAFLYFPIGHSQKQQQDDFKLMIDNGKTIKRLIYQGGIQYTEQQNKTIQKFKQYLYKQKTPLDKRWSRAWLYKFIQSTGYDYSKAANEIVSHNKYKQELSKKDFSQMELIANKFLKSGAFYISGRDSKFRPIVIFNIERIVKLKFTQDQLFQGLSYFMEFIFRYMFVDGQVQNVILVLDIGFTSPFQLVSPMKMTISFLQGNYKYKMHAAYILQPTRMFSFAYSIAKKFMKEDTIRKVNLIDGKIVEPLLQYCHPSQLQKKYGGTLPNFQAPNYWPPQILSHQFDNPKVKRNIITIQQYQQKFLHCELTNRKIYKPYVQNLTSNCEQILKNNRRLSKQNIAQIASERQNEKKWICSRFLDFICCRKSNISRKQNSIHKNQEQRESQKNFNSQKKIEPT